MYPVYLLLLLSCSVELLFFDTVYIEVQALG